MPVRQMKLRFNAKPTTRVVPSLLVSEPQAGMERGNKQASGDGKPILKVAGLPPPPAEAPPPTGSG